MHGQVSGTVIKAVNQVPHGLPFMTAQPVHVGVVGRTSFEQFDQTHQLLAVTLA
jgi:hypothetical protein